MQWNSPKPPSPAPRPAGTVLWTLVKGSRTARAELREQGAAGWEIQLFIDDGFNRGQRHAGEAAAVRQAGEWRSQLKAKGWTAQP